MVSEELRAPGWIEEECYLKSFSPILFLTAAEISLTIIQFTIIGICLFDIPSSPQKMPVCQHWNS